MLRTELRKVQSSNALPIPLEDVKLDLRVDSDDEDATIERMIRAAASFLERRTGWTVLPARYHAVYSQWPCEPQEIYRAPLRELVAVEYLSATNTWTEVDVDNFQVSKRQKSFVIAPLSTFEAPDLFTDMDSVRFIFEAGFDIDGDAESEFSDNEADELPMDPDVKVLLIMLVGELYKTRELSAQDQEAAMAKAAGSMLGAHRTFW